MDYVKEYKSNDRESTCSPSNLDTFGKAFFKISESEENQREETKFKDMGKRHAKQAKKINDFVLKGGDYFTKKINQIDKNRIEEVVSERQPYFDYVTSNFGNPRSDSEVGRLNIDEESKKYCFYFRDEVGKENIETKKLLDNKNIKIENKKKSENRERYEETEVETEEQYHERIEKERDIQKCRIENMDTEGESEVLWGMLVSVKKPSKNDDEDNENVPEEKDADEIDLTDQKVIDNLYKISKNIKKQSNRISSIFNKKTPEANFEKRIEELKKFCPVFELNHKNASELYGLLAAESDQNQDTSGKNEEESNLIPMKTIKNFFYRNKGKEDNGENDNEEKENDDEDEKEAEHEKEGAEEIEVMTPEEKKRKNLLKHLENCIVYDDEAERVYLSRIITISLNFRENLVKIKKDLENAEKQIPENEEEKKEESEKETKKSWKEKSEEFGEKIINAGKKISEKLQESIISAYRYSNSLNAENNFETEKFLSQLVKRCDKQLEEVEERIRNRGKNESEKKEEEIPETGLKEEPKRNFKDTFGKIKSCTENYRNISRSKLLLMHEVIQEQFANENSVATKDLIGNAKEISEEIAYSEKIFEKNKMQDEILSNDKSTEDCIQKLENEIKEKIDSEMEKLSEELEKQNLEKEVSKTILKQEREKLSIKKHNEKLEEFDKNLANLEENNIKLLEFSDSQKILISSRIKRYQTIINISNPEEGDRVEIVNKNFESDYDDLKNEKNVLKRNGKKTDLYTSDKSKLLKTVKEKGLVSIKTEENNRTEIQKEFEEEFKNIHCPKMLCIYRFADIAMNEIKMSEFVKNPDFKQEKIREEEPKPKKEEIKQEQKAFDENIREIAIPEAPVRREDLAKSIPVLPESNNKTETYMIPNPIKSKLKNIKEKTAKKIKESNGRFSETDKDIPTDKFKELEIKENEKIINFISSTKEELCGVMDEIEQSDMSYGLNSDLEDIDKKRKSRSRNGESFEDILYTSKACKEIIEGGQPSFSGKTKTKKEEESEERIKKARKFGGTDQTQNKEESSAQQFYNRRKNTDWGSVSTEEYGPADETGKISALAIEIEQGNYDPEEDKEINERINDLNLRQEYLMAIIQQESIEEKKFQKPALDFLKLQQRKWGENSDREKGNAEAQVKQQQDTEAKFIKNRKRFEIAKIKNQNRHELIIDQLKEKMKLIETKMKQFEEKFKIQLASDNSLEIEFEKVKKETEELEQNMKKNKTDMSEFEKIEELKQKIKRNETEMNESEKERYIMKNSTTDYNKKYKRCFEEYISNMKKYEEILQRCYDIAEINTSKELQSQRRQAI
jgi:hypothetical protein